MKLKLSVVAIFIFLNFSCLLAKTPTLYVVTRSTKTFKLGSQDNPTVGLFSTNDNGKNWQHFGWKYCKTFSGSTFRMNGKQTFYLAAGNGVLKSEDNGKNWKITTGWNITECLKVVVDPKNRNIVYAATAYGIFKTVDGGKRWDEKNIGLTSTFTPTLIIDTKNSELLFCATESGIHQSQNGGNNWEPIALLGEGIRTIIQHPNTSEVLAVGTEDDGVFISDDYGKTWLQKNNGLTHKTVYALTFSPNDEKTIYAGTFQGGIFKSENGGETWQAKNTNLRVLDIHALLVEPKNPEIVYAGTLNDGIWMSNNAGEDWHFIGLETSQVWDIFMD
jgi:photosystem II stability/assembly factor-like uncharacterized protein